LPPVIVIINDLTECPPFHSRIITKLLRGRERERGIKTKMHVKLAAKMLVIAWTLMKKREVFNPDYIDIE